MAFTRPIDQFRWTIDSDGNDIDVVDPTSGQNNAQEPPESKKDSGWVFSEFPTRNQMNWLFRNASKWINYLDTQRATNFFDGYGFEINGADAYDIDINPGVCTDSTNSDIITLGSTLIKQIDAVWAAGTNQGGRASAVSLTDDTEYTVYMIRDSLTGVVDAGFDTSATASNLLIDSGYDQYRKIGAAIYKDSSWKIDGRTYVTGIQGQKIICDFTMEITSTYLSTGITLAVSAMRNNDIVTISFPTAANISNAGSNALQIQPFAVTPSDIVPGASRNINAIFQSGFHTSPDNDIPGMIVIPASATTDWVCSILFNQTTSSDILRATGFGSTQNKGLNQLTSSYNV